MDYIGLIKLLICKEFLQTFDGYTQLLVKNTLYVYCVKVSVVISLAIGILNQGLSN